MTRDSSPSLSRAEESFFEQTPPPSPNRPLFRALQVLIFVGLISLSVYPYFRHQFPALERITHPSSQAERLADRALRYRRFQKALAGYKRALSTRDILTSQHPPRRLGRLHLKMSICFMHMRKFNDSIKQGELALKTYPGWKLPLPHRILLQLYPLQRQSKRLIKLATLVETKFPKDKFTWLLLGDGFLRLRMPKRALRSYREGLKRFPKDLELLNHYARFLATTKEKKIRDLKKALRLSQTALKLSKGRDFDTLNTLVGVNIQMRNLERAEVLAKQALMAAKQRRDKKRALQQMLMIRQMRKQLAVPLANVRRQSPVRPALAPRSTVVNRTLVVKRTPALVAKPGLRPLRRVVARKPATRPARRKVVVPWNNPFLPSRRTHDRSKKLLLP